MDTMKTETRSLTAAKRRLLELLKRLGPSTAAVLAKQLGLTVVAVRQHLQALEKLGLVAQEKQPPRGRGRPSVHWSLTALAAEIFPDRHAELTVDLIEAAREAFGADGLKRLIEVRAREQTASYARLVPDEAAPLKQRLEALAVQRSAEGYMAEALEQDDGSLLLVEHHCPICEAAKSCTGLCSAELDVFRSTLGQKVRVERVQHLLAGGDRCTYRVASLARGDREN